MYVWTQRERKGQRVCGHFHAESDYIHWAEISQIPLHSAAQFDEQKLAEYVNLFSAVYCKQKKKKKKKKYITPFFF